MSTKQRYGYEGSASSHRLTPDITVGAYMMTKRQYDVHLQMLKDIDSGKAHRWRERQFSERNPLPRDEELVWFAIYRQGLAKQVDYAPYDVLTGYGELYLDQRTGGASRDRSRRPRRARSARRLNRPRSRPSNRRMSSRDVPATIRIRNREYRVEARPTERDGVRYHLTGARGGRFYTMRNAHRPHHMFIVSQAMGNKTLEGVWLTDEGGTLRVLRG